MKLGVRKRILAAVQEDLNKSDKKIFAVKGNLLYI